MGAHSGTCSSDYNLCEQSTYCPPKFDSKRNCKPCNADQPFGSQCICGKQPFTGCAECGFDGVDAICKNCANNYFLEGNTCSECQDCPTCSALDICLSCRSGQYLEGGICKNCSESMPESSLCYCKDLKIQFCIVCSEDSCQMCKEGYVPYGQKCHKECEKDSECEFGQFCEELENGIKKCERCSPGCVTCEGAAERCTACTSGMHVNADSACVLCHLAIVEGAVCNCDGKLIEDCKTCEKSQVCDACFDGYNLKNNYCFKEGDKRDKKEQKCTVGYILKENICVQDVASDITEITKSSSVGVAFSVIGMLILITLVVTVVILLIKKQQKNKKLENKQDEEASDIEEAPMVDQLQEMVIGKTIELQDE